MKRFLKKHKDEIQLLANGKIKCLVTGHEMTKDLEAMEKHWSGKSYKKKKRAYKTGEAVNLEEFEWIIPHKFEKNKAFCVLTKDTLNRDIDEIKRHVEGRRYLRKLEEKMETLARKRARAERREAKRKKLQQYKSNGGDSEFWIPPDEDEMDDEDDEDDDDYYLQQRQHRKGTTRRRYQGRDGEKNKEDVGEGDDDFEVAPATEVKHFGKNDNDGDEKKTMCGKHNDGSPDNDDSEVAIREAMASVAAAELRMKKKKTKKKQKKKKNNNNFSSDISYSNHNKSDRSNLKKPAFSPAKKRKKQKHTSSPNNNSYSNNNQKRRKKKA
mmetsp:Transcript_19942/g.27684  ORF Transcript_19942/g.27684 Transcript_19942/m.27684 type:complete len:325 (-) Transcript_19942:177-1151(-)